MSNPEKLPLPEGLQQSRHIGDVPATVFPWLHEAGARRVDISELTFGEDKTIYIASAIPPKLGRLTKDVRDKDAYESPDGRYDRLDEFFIAAAGLEASGEAIRSDRIGVLKGRSKDYAQATIKAYKESPRPNTRRMYYAFTRLSSFQGKNEHDTSGLKLVDKGYDPLKINPEAQLLVRLGYADKQNQLDVLYELTGKSRQELRKKGAGSV